jgi:phosphatidylinositol glycan class T
VSFIIGFLFSFTHKTLAQHYTVVPLALGQVLREYSVTELHLSLNAGKWNYKSWGAPIVPNVASGAELWAWMGHSQNDTTEM